MAAGGLTRREEINRLEYTRALLDNPKITWRQAQKQLDKSQVTILNQMARMKAEDKQKWSEYHKNDYKQATKNWQALARKNPEQKQDIQKAMRQAQLKMVFGKDVLTDKEKLKINKLLKDLLKDTDDFGSYWGY